MKIWAKTKEFSEGKFLVVRRDGTIPAWPHFVLGARDPVVPFALHAYANRAEEMGFDAEYCQSIRELAEDFLRYRRTEGAGDPDASPHRTDDPAVIAAMRGAPTATLNVRREKNHPKDSLRRAPTSAPPVPAAEAPCFCHIGAPGRIKESCPRHGEFMRDAAPPGTPAPTAVTACEPAQLICGHCGEASIDHMGAGNDCAGGETTFETATDFNQALRRASATADISEGGVGPHDWRPYPGMGWECRCGWLRRVAGAGELSTSFEYRPLGKRVWQPVEPSCSGTGRSPGRAR